MPNPRLALTEPLTLGESAIPGSSRCSGKATAVLSLLIGLVFAAMLFSLMPFASGGDRQHLMPENLATTMFGGPLTFRPHTGLVPVAPSARNWPRVSVNAISRARKEEQMYNLRNDLESKGDLVVVMERGPLKADQGLKIRRALKKANSTYRVMKKTLNKIVFAGTEREELNTLFEGETALILANDPVGAAKAIDKLVTDKEINSKDSKLLQVRGGFMDGQMLDAAAIKQLSKVPSLQESQTAIAVMLNQPATKIARAANGVSSKLARALKLAVDENKFSE